MNKTAIKNFSVEARKNLLYQVAKKAEYYGITSEKMEPVKGEAEDGIVIGDRVHIKKIKKQREDLVTRVKEKGYEQLMEEAAYTWFNRFIALRFMEVNDYLPAGVRVLSSITPDKTEPDIITSALSIDLPLDKEIIYGFQDCNDSESLYKYLLVAQCNELYKILPFLFEEILDYTELLLPDNLLFSDSVIRKLVAEIPEEDFREVEIIGWLYQFYISEKKDEVFADLKKNIKISKENIPAATQLFTPAWIVKYMVENSAGRLWLEAHPDSELQDKWKYYIEPAEQDLQVRKQLDEIIDKNLKPESIKILDPCMGSGHILVYAFEVMYEIYRSAGYSEKEIPGLILTKNLYGLDIDDRASQLACFAVMMKARSYNRRVFREEISLNLCAIQDFGAGAVRETPLQGYPLLTKLCEQFVDGKEFGSLIGVTDFDRGEAEKEFERFEKECDVFSHHLVEKVREIVKQAGILAGKYDVVVTNPPYMGTKGMTEKLGNFVKNVFPDTKNDLFACFIERGFKLVKSGKFNTMVTMQSWMFLSSLEQMRLKILNKVIIVTMVHMANMVLGIAFGTAATVFRNITLPLYKGSYSYTELTDINENGEPFEFPVRNDRLSVASTVDFEKIPGSPVAYWVTDKVRDIFQHSESLRKIAEPRQGLATSDNSRFLRLWYEVINKKIGYGYLNREEAGKSGLKWFPYNKGGEFRKWYGNNEYTINWEGNGREVLEYAGQLYGSPTRTIKNIPYYFKESITWSFISSSNFGVRYCPQGFIFDVGGSSVFLDKNKICYITAFLCSKLVFEFLKMLNPTLNFQAGNIASLPIIFPSDESIKTIIDTLTQENIHISRRDWDSFETSWDFQLHPFLQHRTDGRIQNAFNSWKNFTESQFNQLKSNEEELNRLFIEIYDLSDELTPEVEDKDITIRKADLERDVKSFLSYAVGCMMGRYSIDSPGLIYAGDTFDHTKYKTYPADDDGIIPVLSADWFDDDIVAGFIDFLRVTFGEDNLYENIDFIASALGKTDNETSRERIRKYFLNDFYKDHVRIYQKRPVYWLFTSGKNKAFNALIYLHRYDRSTIAKMRIDYLHELQGKLEVSERHVRENSAQMKDAREKKQTEKKLSGIAAHKDELRKYDELVRHMADMQVEIDLDDGVVVNYEKFKGLVGKI
ncbi:MAG: BREX-1 system adenine-specific DNA-methyltransferase PglX [Candidatus Eremiobacterota bacterium]